ncbi:Bacterial regulatory protein, luxR family [compost metagenome]
MVKQPDKIIASELNISPDTVSTHLQNIRNKTGLKNKSELSIFAYQKGLIKS